LFSGSTTGFVVSFPGANAGSNIPRNFIIKQGDVTGGAALDVSGNIRASNQLVSLVSTGTPPFVVNSTTPVTNLTASPTAYISSGATVAGAHIVQGFVSATTSGTAVTLSGAAAFTNSTSYVCTLGSAGAFQNYVWGATSGSSFSVASQSSTANISYICSGN
jgi:hypothetical protein